MAAVSSDGTILVWRIADGTLVATLGRPVVRDRDPGWGRLIPEQTPERHEQLQVLPSAVTFTSSAAGLVSADRAGVITVWDLATGAVVVRHVASAPVLSLASWHDLIAAGESGGGLCVLRVHGLPGLERKVPAPPPRSRPWWRFWARGA